MSLPLVSLRDVTYRIAGNPLFEKLSLHLSANDRVCLVGRNGCGKSTMMRLIVGELEPDIGERFLHPGTRVGYVSQTLDKSVLKAASLYEYVLEGLELEDGQTHETERYRADQVMQPLELSGDRVPATLSGGQLRRAALAKALVHEPEVLLLDEPTNHLDIAVIEWLEKYLATYPGGLLCVSHDRTFMERISNKTFWLERGVLRVNPKSYADFERWSEQIYAEEEAALRKMQRKMSDELQWMYGGGVTARRKRNMGRVRELARLREKLQQRKTMFQAQTGSVSLPALEKKEASKLVVEMEGVCKAFEGKMVLDGFSSRIMRGDRIGILGPNGSGKSTLLNIMTGQLERDSGRLRRKHELSLSFFDQKRSGLLPDKTPWQFMCPTGGDQVCVGGKWRHVVGYLKDFMFDPKQVHAKIATLSGGQAGRLLLAKVLADPGELLVMDEPTNDLDMDTLDMLQELLAEYQGTLLLVSHDRDFLDRVVSRMWVFEGDGKIGQFVGGYRDYLRQCREGERKGNSSEKEQSAPAKVAASKNTSTAKLSYKYQRALEVLPGQIESLHTQIGTLEEQLAAIYAGAEGNAEKLLVAITDKQARCEQLEAEWMEAEEAREALGSVES